MKVTFKSFLIGAHLEDTLYWKHSFKAAGTVFMPPLMPPPAAALHHRPLRASVCSLTSFSERIQSFIGLAFF